MDLEKLFPRIFGERKLRIREKTLAPRLEAASNRPKEVEADFSNDMKAKAQEEAGELASGWARAVCLPPERQELPLEELTSDEVECIERGSRYMQRELMEAIGAA